MSWSLAPSIIPLSLSSFWLSATTRSEVSVVPKPKPSPSAVSLSALYRRSESLIAVRSTYRILLSVSDPALTYLSTLGITESDFI